MNNIATFFRESMVGRFLIPAGVMLIVFSIILFFAVDHNKNYIKTDAVVSMVELTHKAYTDEDGNHIDATYNIYVMYTADGREYEEYLGEFSNYKKGDKLTICYNPENPRQISQPVSLIWPIAMLIGGIGALVAGIISIIIEMKKHKALRLQEEGWKNGK